MGERIVVIDADLALSAGLDVAGWRLERPPVAEFERLTPQQAAQPWDSATRSGRCCVLRRTDATIVTPKGLRLPRGIAEDLTSTKLRIDAWAPLLLLNLWQSNDPVRVAVEYDVDPGRYVERARGRGLDTVPVSPDGEYEEPVLGPLHVASTEIGIFRCFLEELSARLSTVEDLAATERLRRSAHTYLMLGFMLGTEGDVTYPRNRPEVIYRYVACMEHLLVRRNEDANGKAQVLAERVAVVLARDADEHNSIDSDLAKAYQIRNSKVHGGTPPVVDSAFPKILRGHARRLFVRLIVLGPEFDPPRDCQQALRSADFRTQQITERIPASLDPIA